MYLVVVSLGEDVVFIVLNGWCFALGSWVVFECYLCGVWWGFVCSEEDCGSENCVVISEVCVCECLGHVRCGQAVVWL